MAELMSARTPGPRVSSPPSPDEPLGAAPAPGPRFPETPRTAPATPSMVDRMGGARASAPGVSDIPSLDEPLTPPPRVPGPAEAVTPQLTPAVPRAPRIEPRPDLPAAALAPPPWEASAGATELPPAVTPLSTEVIEVRARPAALWQRITAFIVDGALVFGVLALYVGLAAALITPRGVPATQLTGIDGLMARVHQLHSVLAPCVALALVLGLVYTAAFALLWNGRTPGRRLLGIRLVDRSGLAPAPGRAIARAVLALVSFVPFLAGFWLALFDRRGQTLHDKLTQTFVVRPG